MYNPYYCFNEIYIPDQLLRQKMYTSMQIFRIKRVHVSYTQKNIVSNPGELSLPLALLTLLTGQRSTVVWARQSVSSWKLRKNTVIGCKVSLGGKLAFAFLEKLYIHGLYKPLLTQKSNFLNKQGGFGVSENLFFFELQNFNVQHKLFSGFYIAIS